MRWSASATPLLEAAVGPPYDPTTGMPLAGVRNAAMKLLASTLTRVLAWAAALALPAAAAAQDHAVPAFDKVDSMEARVQGCVTCHGQSGQGTNSGYFPRIAGKPAGYLYNQLVAFRDGRRSYPPMNYLVAYLPDAYLREMADYYARLRPPFEARDAAPADRAMLERGKVIATTGDPRSAIPPCIACHGARLTGMEPGIPGLVGLRAAYISAQLTRWRAARRWSSPAIRPGPSRPAPPATARASPAWSRGSPAWSACARPTSSAS